MSTYIITEAPSDDVKVYISQQNLEAIVSTLKHFYQRSSRFKIWELRLVNINLEFCPKETVPIALVAKIEPHDQCTHHAHHWGHSLDELPLEQAEIEISSMRDYIDQKEREARMRRSTEEAKTKCQTANPS